MLGGFNIRELEIEIPKVQNQGKQRHSLIGLAAARENSIEALHP